MPRGLPYEKVVYGAGFVSACLDKCKPDEQGDRHATFILAKNERLDEYFTSSKGRSHFGPCKIIFTKFKDGGVNVEVRPGSK